jgi:signal transduction histidine kinase
VLVKTLTLVQIRNPLGAVFHCSDATQETLADMTVLANKLASTTESEIGEQLRELIASGVDSVSTIISCSLHQKRCAHTMEVPLVVDHANFVCRIVDDILVLSKLDSNLLQISPSTVRVTTLLHDVEKMFEAEAQRSDVQLETRAHASLEQMEVNWVLLDPGRIQQVLINLITNAIKFCKKKSQRKVTIRVGASKIRPSENVLPNIDFVVAHSLHDSVYDDPKFESQSFYIWFSVEDTGRGMSADEKSRIFARFTQGSPRTESEYGGSGLGLFISRELAELQGGEIGKLCFISVAIMHSLTNGSLQAWPANSTSAAHLPFSSRPDTQKPP